MPDEHGINARDMLVHLLYGLVAVGSALYVESNGRERGGSRSMT
jgi:hypothetical protein